MPRHLTTTDINTTNMVLPEQIGVASGVAGLDGTGKVPLSQLPTIATGTVTSVNGQTGIVNLTATQVNAVPTSSVGQTNGVAALDNTGKIPVSQIPTTNLVLTGSIGSPNGVAGLDSSAKVPVSSLITNVANGVAKLDGSGVLAAAQSLVKSVNTQTGNITLGFADVGAIDASLLGVNNGVAQLNSSGKLPIGQVPDLTSLYMPAPGSTASAAGQVYTSTGVGSNSAQWTSPLFYTAANSAGRPVAPPAGSLVTQRDTNSTYIYGGSQWFRADTDISIPKYASDAAVTNDFPSPAVGQCIMRTDIGLGTLMKWSGTRWVAESALIAETSGATGNVTFSSIPQVWRSLRLVIGGLRITAAATHTFCAMWINGDNATSGHYHNEWSLSGNGSGTLATSSGNTQNGLSFANHMFLSVGGSIDGASGGYAILDFPQYTSNNSKKACVSSSGLGDGHDLSVRMAAYCSINNLNPITSITVGPQGSTWVNTSTFSLYGFA